MAERNGFGNISHSSSFPPDIVELGDMRIADHSSVLLYHRCRHAIVRMRSRTVYPDFFPDRPPQSLGQPLWKGMR